MTAGFGQTNTCGTSLGINATCSVSVTFIPGTQGSATGTLTLNSNLPGAAPSFSLSGTGTASAATLSATSLTFASQIVGTTSAAQQVTLTNSGTASLNISSISASGDFAQTNNCPSSLGSGTNCTVSVTFIPKASGNRAGTLSIADDAVAGSPQTVSLNGTSYTVNPQFNVSSLTFASQRVGTTSAGQNVTLSNTGSGPLSISGFVLAADFGQTNNCPASLGAGGTCTISVTFQPTARGIRSGTLTLSSNAPETPPSVSLSGAGIGPVASLSPSSLTFAPQTVSTTSSSQNVTLSNTGDATLDISNVTASGNFAETNNCATTLSAGAHCTVSVTFTPTAAGALTGTLTVADDASNGSPQTTSLSGTGADFSLGASPSSVTVTHGNSVNVVLTVSALGGSFNSNVNLACSAGLPKGANCSFSPGGVTPGSSSATSTMKISTNGSTPVGSYVLTVRGTTGSLAHTTQLVLNVN